jgi:hypothetical protein
MSSISSNRATEPVGHYPHAPRVGLCSALALLGIGLVAAWSFHFMSAERSCSQ